MAKALTMQLRVKLDPEMMKLLKEACRKLDGLREVIENLEERVRKLEDPYYKGRKPVMLPTRAGKERDRG